MKQEKHVLQLPPCWKTHSANTSHRPGIIHFMKIMYVHNYHKYYMCVVFLMPGSKYMCVYYLWVHAIQITAMMWGVRSSNKPNFLLRLFCSIHQKQYTSISEENEIWTDFSKRRSRSSTSQITLWKMLQVERKKFPCRFDLNFVDCI